MADLDDFFAKKDRKKSKGNKKFTTTEEVAKKLEDSAKKPEKTVQKKERAPEGEDGATQSHEQDEWKEFEEEKKDYTGLKIGNLAISSSGDGNQNTQDNTSEQQQGYDSGNDTEKKLGPWKRLDLEASSEEPQPQSQPQPQPKPSKPPQQTTPAPATNTSYVAPRLRNPTPQQPQQPLQPTRLRSKAAPDIHNEEYFPSLSGSKTDRRNRSEGSFEVVSHNKSTTQRHAEQTKASSGAGPKLNLGNRYNTLSNDS